MSNTKYWLATVSKEHVQRAVEGGFMQVNHGKLPPLKRMHKGDGVVFYSSKTSMTGTDKLQAFTAIGVVADDDIYQVTMRDDFMPYRRNVNYKICRDASILPLINGLNFIPDKKSWGYPFRYGFIEISQQDYDLISAQMLTDKDR